MLQKFTVTLLLLVMFLILSQVSAFANTQELYDTFLGKYEIYRSKHNEYITTRNQYFQFQTLVAKNAALESVKEFLLARSGVLDSYFELLISRNTDQLYINLIGQERDLISSSNETVSAIGSLEDAVRASDIIEDRHVAFQNLSRQVTGSVILKKVEALTQTFVNLEQEANVLVIGLKLNGKDTARLERWVLDARNKRVLAEGKISDARSLINNLNSEDLNKLSVDYSEIQFTIFEANQYLKEGVAFLGELSESMRYGEY